MNCAHFLSAALLSALLLPVAPAFGGPTDSQNRCDAPRSPADRRACEAAREGPQALRRFIWRTQGIYGLHFGDYMTAEDIDRYHERQAARGLAEQRRQVADGRAN